jgi:hypothetical protein
MADQQQLEFDTTDLMIGLGIAASAGAHLYPATACLCGLFVATKVARQSDDVRAIISSCKPLLTSGAARARDLLAQQAGAVLPQRTDSQPSAQTYDDAPTLAADRPLLDQLEESPHLLVIGHTRGGKTTLMHELAQRKVRAGARVLVADPDAAPGVWPGCRVYGGGDDFGAIAAMLEYTSTEVGRRRQQRAAGQRSFKPVYIVMDEIQDTFAEVEGAQPLFETIARRGAKLNMHLIAGVQDKSVKTLGLEGKSALLNNMLITDVYKDQRTGQRVARMRFGDEKVTLPIPALPDPEQLVQSQPQTPRTAVGHTAGTHSHLVVTPQAAPSNSVTTAAVSGETLLAQLLGASCDQDATKTRPHDGVTKTRPPCDQGVTPDEDAESGVTSACGVTNSVTSGVTIVTGAPAPPGVHVVFADTGTTGSSLTLVLPKDGRIDRDSKIKTLVAVGGSLRKVQAFVGGNSKEVRASYHKARAEQGKALADDDMTEPPDDQE